MKKVQMKGKSVDEAVESAAKVLGVEKEKLQVKVLSEGKSGVLGIGGAEAEIEACLPGSLLDDAKQVLQEIMDKMNFMAIVDGKQEEDVISLDIKGDDMGRIIGKEGQTLRSLEILVRTILFKSRGEGVRLNIDAGGYKDKRKGALERLAKEVADEVVEGGVEKSMPNLSPADRRVVHMFLKADNRIKTESRGEGRDRKLFVFPA